MDISPKGLLTVAVIAGVWLIMMSSVALHLTLNEGGSEGYSTFTKWFSSLSIVAGIGLLAGAAYYIYLNHS